MRTNAAITIDLRELGDDSTPYPFILAYAQDDHESFLVRQLEHAGARVEWNTKIEVFTHYDTQVIATVARAGGGRDEISAAYICGCDGPHSRVREVTGVGFPGGTYDQHFYVGDVKTMQATDNDLRMTLGEDMLALMLPVRTAGMQRLIGRAPTELNDRRDLSFEDICERVESLLGISVVNVNWFSTYRVHTIAASSGARCTLSGRMGTLLLPRPRTPRRNSRPTSTGSASAFDHERRPTNNSAVIQRDTRCAAR